MEALTEAMKAVLQLFQEYSSNLKQVTQIIFITDRFGLRDSGRTNAYQINSWRGNGWKNHEGKPIKNHLSIDKLDKMRTKLAKATRTRISIEYRRRKENKTADKLAKKGKTEGVINNSLSKNLEKIGKRKFDGGEVTYKSFTAKDLIRIHIFRKDPVHEGWEISAEIMDGLQYGKKLKIYVDDVTASELSRMNQYVVKVKEVNKFHLRIYKTIKKVK